MIGDRLLQKMIVHLPKLVSDPILYAFFRTLLSGSGLRGDN